MSTAQRFRTPPASEQGLPARWWIGFGIAGILFFYCAFAWSDTLPLPLIFPLSSISPALAQDVPTLPNGLPILMQCGEVTQSGSYKLTQDLVANPGSTCLEIHDAKNVELDCAGFSILSMGAPSAVSVAHVQGLTIENCQLRDVANLGLLISDSSNIILRNNKIQGANVNSPSAGTASNLQIQENVFTEYLQLYHTSSSRIAYNKFQLPEASGGASALMSDHGQSNTFESNEIDGGWTWNSAPKTGPHDGMVLSLESGSAVRNNQISNNWDCGIETVGLLTNVTVSENSIRSNGLCGIGGWEWNSWRGNNITNNSFDRVGMMFLFGRRFGLTADENYVYFQDNTFSGNRILSFAELDPGIYAADFDFVQIAAVDHFGRTPAVSPWMLGNNVFRNNDFGKDLQAPRLATSALAVDGGGNICKTSSDPGYPLACGRAAGAVTVGGANGLAFSPRIYPNPWRPDRGYDAAIHFDQLGGPADLKLFTLAGHWIKTIHTEGASLQWDLTNDSSQRVASGHYLYLLTNSSGQKKVGQVVVLR